MDFASRRVAAWERYLRVFARWIVLALLAGTLCGAVGSAFHHSVHLAGELRERFPWLLWLLPAAGLAIVRVYQVTKTEGQGTNDILDQIHQGKKVSPWLLPAIFLCTALTHLCGGSAGREGAALQMGGVIGYHSARLFRMDDTDRRTATVAGMAAFFTALFGTPMTATVFALTVVSVGRMYQADMFPCLLSSLTAYGVSRLLNVEPTRFTVEVPALSVGMAAKVILLSMLCALLSVLFCETIHVTERVFHRGVKNPWVRAAVGGGVIVILTLLCGTRDYNGAGMEVITAAVEQGTARPGAFLLKLLFTAVTLAAGFKGGEVVPSFFVGAAFGAAVGPLLGIPAGFAAALGLTGVFCGATNTALASVFLGVELFGAEGLAYYGLTCAVSFVLSGYSGLYSSQTILYSKFKARYINVHANARRVWSRPAPPRITDGTDKAE
ncbi:MAG: chloride channel protein [Oscillibacter sp.]|nr:chloride channel protein [Oscillibacter sp.]